jgi:hypothetical protein
MEKTGEKAWSRRKISGKQKENRGENRRKYRKKQMLNLGLTLDQFKFTQPLTVTRVQLLYTAKEKGGKPDLRNPYRNFKIMPRNLTEIVRS